MGTISLSVPQLPHVTQPIYMIFVSLRIEHLVFLATFTQFMTKLLEKPPIAPSFSKYKVTKFPDLVHRPYFGFAGRSLIQHIMTRERPREVAAVVGVWRTASAEG